MAERRSYVSSSHEETPGERSAVYVTMNRVRTAAEPIENAAIVGEGIDDWLRDVDGFEGMLMLSREGTSIGLTFWESREVAEKYRPLRMQFLEKVLSAVGVDLEESLDFDVTFAKLGPNLAELTP
jgi:hypothetical protein